MNKKNCDSYGRFRSKTIAFRVSPEENELINNYVAISGLTKQEFLTSNMLKHTFVVKGTPKVYLGLKKQLEAVESAIKSNVKTDWLNKEQLELIKTIYDICDQMKR